ncbi:unnamed protein product [Ambrosiozyma monospora]|uniref:EKC/KEOPS complex subunit BUD32 n=1 Tax=Ambrosiozyma monospora TaxID=43982 RepID=A0A9W7DD99_AMBMO|nr:unnamed protein product [Ambrosiozyma monospora]
MSKEIIAAAQSHLHGVDLQLISQGAEALVFKTNTHPYLPTYIKPSDIQNTTNYIIKYRPFKPYRHPVLDKQLTKSRTASEAKLLSRLYTLGVPAPKLIATDAPNGIIWMECLGYDLENNGGVSSLKNWLWMLEKQFEQEQDPEKKRHNIALGDEVKSVMELVGKAVGHLHLQDIVHGDLTSSNIILVKDEENNNQPTLIDFGLSSYSSLVEDKSVDLYVLERALTSTHPMYSQQYNDWLLDGYEQVHRENKAMKKHAEIVRRLKDVRMRGRKRSMLG